MSTTKPAAPVKPVPGEKPSQDLSKVNEKLRELIASLKTARERQEGALVTQGDAPRTQLAGDEVPAREDAAAVREALAALTAERDELRQRLEALEHENTRVSDDYVAVQERISEFAQLYVALERLHGGLTRADTLQALQEIVINVIGSEEFAVFEQLEGRLSLIHHFGVNPVPLREVRIGDGVIGRTAQRGQTFVVGRDGPVDASDADVTASVPLFAGPRLWGVLTVFRLLGHKPMLGEADQTVFDLLQAHAGLALSLRESH
jgi:hypothetical protein